MGEKMNNQQDDKQPWENWSEEDWEKNASAWDDWQEDAQPEAQEPASEAAAPTPEQEAPAHAGPAHEPSKEQLPPHTETVQQPESAAMADGKGSSAGLAALLKNKKLLIAIGAALALVALIALALMFSSKNGGGSTGGSNESEIKGYTDAPEELTVIENRGGVAVYGDSKLVTWSTSDEDDLEMWDLGSGEVLWEFDTRELGLDDFKTMVVAPQPAKNRVLISAWGAEDDGALAVIDGGNGELVEQHEMDGYQAYGASGDGSVLLIEIDEPSQADKDAGNYDMRETTSKLEGTDPGKAVWTIDTSIGQCTGETGEIAMGEPINGHLFLPQCGEGAPIVSMETGEEPNWIRKNRGYRPLGTKYVLETHDGRSTILDWQGEKLWDSKIEGEVFAVGDEVFVLDGRRIGKLNVAKGEFDWEERLSKRQRESFGGGAAPVLDGKAYLAEVDDDLVELTSLDLSNGKLADEPQIVTFEDVRDEISPPSIHIGEGRLVLATMETGDGGTTFLSSVKPGAKEPSWSTSFDGGSLTQMGNRLLMHDFEAEEFILLG